MGKKYLLLIVSFVTIVAILVVLLFNHHGSIAVLSPEGKIAGHQRDLLVFATGLSLLVIIPVFTLAFYIAWKYHEDNKKSKYQPKWDHNHSLEFVWWTIPIILIIILAIVTWKSSHDLDPYKPIESHKKPLTVQVVALEWKWLFIYPEQNIATVNYLEIPEKTPINFQITADAPMNSFWIPKLGGQVYAMAGMQTKLHLMADKTGTYNGASANLSGEGFSGMKFIVKSSTEGDFGTWVNNARHSKETLSKDAYTTLAKPSKNNAKQYYSSVDPALYDTVMKKYMAPPESHKEGEHAR
jgi:cytochrome o ubiquinol oxidase subunit 2